jgi:hypothetical protein
VEECRGIRGINIGSGLKKAQVGSASKDSARSRKKIACNVGEKKNPKKEKRKKEKEKKKKNARDGEPGR